MKLATSNFDVNEKSIESLTATNKVLENQISTQKTKVEALKSALDNASTSFGETDKRTQNWQIQLNNATAYLNKMEREVESNEKSIEQLSIDMKDGANSADDMMSKFAQGGETANEAFFDVVSALDSMKDPIEKNTTAVALFGTQYEDLESTVLPVLSSMQDGAIQTSGALEQINQIKYDNIDSALEGTKRSIQGVFLPAVSEMSSGITDIFSNLANEINQADGNMSEISDSIFF